MPSEAVALELWRLLLRLAVLSELAERVAQCAAKLYDALKSKGLPEDLARQLVVACIARACR